MSLKVWLQAHLSRVSSKPPVVQRRHLPYSRLLGPPPVGIADHLRRTSMTRAPSPASEDGVDKQSPHILLDVLPLEVRQQIWETILGGHSFHLKIRQGQLGALRCLLSDPTNCKDTNWEVHPKHERRERERHRKGRKRDSLLPILQSCKQIYGESVNILYSSNAFLISDIDAMMYLPSLLLPQRIDTIQTLYFNWIDLPSHISTLLQFEGKEDVQATLTYPTAWTTIWRNISAMKGLQTLLVNLSICPNVWSRSWGNMNETTSAKLLAPIKEVTRPSTFILSLPFPPMDNSVAQREIRDRDFTLYEYTLGVHGDWDGIDPWDALHCTIRRTNTL